MRDVGAAVQSFAGGGGGAAGEGCGVHQRKAGGDGGEQGAVVDVAGAEGGQDGGRRGGNVDRGSVLPALTQAPSDAGGRDDGGGAVVDGFLEQRLDGQWCPPYSARSRSMVGT